MKQSDTHVQPLVLSLRNLLKGRGRAKQAWPKRHFSGRVHVDYTQGHGRPQLYRNVSGHHMYRTRQHTVVLSATKSTNRDQTLNSPPERDHTRRWSWCVVVVGEGSFLSVRLLALLTSSIATYSSSLPHRSRFVNAQEVLVFGRQSKRVCCPR